MMLIGRHGGFDGQTLCWHEGNMGHRSLPYVLPLHEAACTAVNYHSATCVKTLTLLMLATLMVNLQAITPDF